MKVPKIDIQVRDLSVTDYETIRKPAVAEGIPDSRGAVARWALIQFARRLRQEALGRERAGLAR